MQTTNPFIKNWLILAVSSLAGAGIYSLPPVLFRGPYFKEILPVEAIFASSLVIHVNLSVLVWMLACGAMLWSQFYQEKYHLLYKSAFYAAAAGMLAMLLSPLVGELNPLKNNYIPVLQNPFFFMGLALFGLGIALQLQLTIISCYKKITNPNIFGLYVAAIITAIAALCFVIAGLNAPEFNYANPTEFYEALFWGGGHILQASYTSLLVVVWFMLLEASGYKNPLKARFIYVLFVINLLFCLPAPFFYLAADSYALFAKHMRDTLGFVPVIAGLAVIYAVLTGKRAQIPLTAKNAALLPFLLFSIALFAYGGVLAYMISGANVTIPAHYHGSIVGISIAFMGLVYHVMPQVGIAVPSGIMARMQPFIYGIGQSMHITGLAVMGGYGALRKDAASSQNIDTILGKALFFSGGSFAILGGLLFVVLAIKSLCKNRVK